MITAIEIVPVVSIVAACWAPGVARATYYRAQQPTACRANSARRTRSPWALSEAEQQHILAVFQEPAYADKSPRTVYAILLDSGRYLASVSTFYRPLT